MYIIISDDVFFQVGMKSVLEGIDYNNEVVILPMGRELDYLNFSEWHHCVVIVFLHTVYGNLIALRLLEAAKENVVFFPKDDVINEVCWAFGFGIARVMSIDDVEWAIHNPIRGRSLIRRELTQMEKFIITELLLERPIAKLEEITGMSCKRIYTHKRRGLLKIGVRRINQLTGSAIKDVFWAL
ncbi:hypothetical protein [Serratia fonticola]|uniref:hypothetical protein n=1 Tax=Serratia fonticola TaxID=47917 RepID=UPI00192D0786|nr:hypothetical protein [Serratia fonticola]